MWVRSQYKCCLVDIKGCFIEDDFSIKNMDYQKEHVYNIVGWMCEPSIEDNKWTLGTYKTKEKAMKVLDDLQCRIARTETGVFQLSKYAEKLDKALDRACEYLEYRDMWLCHYLSQEKYITKEEWKDELLKEVNE